MASRQTRATIFRHKLVVLKVCSSTLLYPVTRSAYEVQVPRPLGKPSEAEAWGNRCYGGGWATFVP